MNLQEKMFDCVERWKKSGMTKVIFIKDTGISIHKFNYWLDKYSVWELVKNKVKPNGVSDFQEIRLPSFIEDFGDKRTIRKLLELSTPSGFKVTIFE